MVGDNCDNSENFDFWGVVDYSRIVGQPWFTYFSITLTDSIKNQKQAILSIAIRCDGKECLKV